MTAVPILIGLLAICKVWLRRHVQLLASRRSHDEAVELVTNDEPDASACEAGTGKRHRNWGHCKPARTHPDSALPVLLDVGDEEFRIAIPKAAISSRGALKRLIREACLEKLGRELTPHQWLSRAKAPGAMSIALTFDNNVDPPTQSKLTEDMSVEHIRQAACAHVMPT